MALVSGMHHVNIKCCNEEEYTKVLHFYKEILGLPIIRQWETGLMFDTGAGIIEVFTNGEEQAETGVIRHFAFATEDADACVKAVSDAGYKVFMGPMDIEIDSEPVYRARIAFCYGPLGEEIEFFQEIN